MTMANKYNKIDNFEIRGFWWLPENENKKVPGVLKFSADKEIKLELMGSFHESIRQAIESKQPQYFETILGESNGTTFTLIRSLEMDKKVGSVGTLDYTLSSFHCGYIIKGIHFLRLDDVKFAQMNINFTYLEDWINSTPFKFEEMNVIRYDAPPEKSIKVEKINSIISIVSCQSVSNDFKTVSMSVHSFFIIRPVAESKDLKWYEDVIGCLGNFLTLVIGKPTYPKTMSAYLSGNYEIEILFASNNTLFEEDIHFSQMMIPYKDLTSYLDRFLNNLFNYSDTLEPVYELFFGTYYAQLYVNFYFLSLMQAIEAFHRRIYGDKGEYLSDSEYEPLKSSLTNSIPTTFPDGSDYPDGFVEALKSKIKFGNEYSLRTRLKQLSNIWGPFNPLLYENKDEFNNYIVFTRNYLTHYEKDPGCRVFEGEYLIPINIIIHSLFLIVLLTHMGIPKLDAFRIVQKHNGKALSKAINEIFQDQVVEI